VLTIETPGGGGYGRATYSPMTPTPS
jgi:N-methylhydantoinase B/oxoprolinase/acetone carboxylase alpha subunit